MEKAARDNGFELITGEAAAVDKHPGSMPGAREMRVKLKHSGPMKLLVVDDEFIVLESCRKVLEADGFEVVLVASAREALDVLKGAEVSLVLVDIKMPEHDGFYLMDVVKERYPETPVLVMSGYHTIDTVEEATRKGAAGFIQKPFNPEELLQAVRRAIGE